MAIHVSTVMCPHCDSLRTTPLPKTNVASTVTWYRCESCDRLFYQAITSIQHSHPIAS